MTLLNGSDHDRESGQCSHSERSVPRQLGALDDALVAEGTELSGDAALAVAALSALAVMV